MPFNPFNRNSIPTPDLKRNNYDLSFANNLTLNFGGLYPCFCKPVVPGDTFEIDTAFGLRFLPTIFPVQTKMRADIHYFYIRNRNLYNEWQEFITNNPVNKGIPYLPIRDVLSQIDSISNEPVPGSLTHLADYFGINNVVTTDKSHVSSTQYQLSTFETFNDSGIVFPFHEAGKTMYSLTEFTTAYADCTRNGYFTAYGYDTQNTNVRSETIGLNKIGNKKLLRAMYYGNLLPFYKFTSGANQADRSFLLVVQESTGLVLFKSGIWSSNMHSNKSWVDWSFKTDIDLSVLESMFDNDDLIIVFNTWVSKSNMFDDGDSAEINYIIPSGVKIPFGAYYNLYERTDINVLNNINSLRFRAYEQIYNAFYRDDRNNPFLINGAPSPNKYLTSTDGGLDTNSFGLRYRNWENDFITTATQRPQAGDAPLVGITDSGVATFTAEDGKQYRAQLKFDELDENQAIGLEFTEQVPASVARSLVNYATSGISINDLRNVNAFQRYLETNQRVGLKYKDQIEGRFGVKISFAELDMPEFIGGATENVSVNQINQTTDSSNAPLGSYAGQLSCVGSSKHTVKQYCDEHGYIIGIISVVPIPIYPMFCDKDFFKTEPLDYWTPEFSHIGNQAIYSREVNFPLGYLEGDEIFGYQRPWYEYLGSLDEAHGLFKSSLSSFVMSRNYSKAELTPQFLTMHPNDVNNVFATDTDSGDKILGQIYFKVTARRPMARFGIPRLES